MERLGGPAQAGRTLLWDLLAFLGHKTPLQGPRGPWWVAPRTAPGRQGLRAGLSLRGVGQPLDVPALWSDGFLIVGVTCIGKHLEFSMSSCKNKVLFPVVTSLCFGGKALLYNATPTEEPFPAQHTPRHLFGVTDGSENMMEVVHGDPALRNVQTSG